MPRVGWDPGGFKGTRWNSRKQRAEAARAMLLCQGFLLGMDQVSTEQTGAVSHLRDGAGVLQLIQSSSAGTNPCRPGKGFTSCTAETRV